MISLSGLPFFGLTPEYRAGFFGQIHEIVFNGNGGYTFTEVYEFPLWLRRFVHRTMVEHFENQNKRHQKESGKGNLLENGQIKAPDYSTKASR